MKNFKSFELDAADVVYGGALEPTTWWSDQDCCCAPCSGTDYYDSATDRYVFPGV